ncbi:MAG: dihydrofolate reductase family protein [Candidatus Levyibacteriota bacterium]
MRKLILFMVYSLDGFVAGQNDELDWEDQDPQIGRTLIPDLLKTVDTMILGRVLYEGFSQAWPAMANDPNNPTDLIKFAHWVIDSPKFVISTTLEKVTWDNSTLIKVQNDDDIVREVKNLKEQPGGDIVLFGGVRLAQTLVRLGLVDEYRFKVQPIVLGNGRALFKDLPEQRKLKLTYSKAFEAGVVALSYEPEK